MASFVLSVQVAVAGVCVFVNPSVVHAASALPDGKKSIFLIEASGKALRIGDATFVGDGKARTFTVDLNTPAFGDQFLSMRPFRCLDGAKEMWCHLPYPYAIASRIQADDLVPLEYALLFLFKPSYRYGIDTRNGVYFKLSLDENGTLRGLLHETSMDPLGIPPDDPAARPITDADLSEGDVDGRRFVRLEIR